MTVNRIVQGLWIGSQLSTMELLCINSYIRNGHEFHLYVYDEMINVSHAKLFDANEIIPEHKIFLDSRGSLATFADWFRYELLYRKGGWWVDMDSVCLKPFDFEEKYCFSTEDNDGLPILNIGFIKSTPNAEFLKQCLDYINKFPTKAGLEWGIFGPRLIREVLSFFSYESYVKAPIVFCPIPYYHVNKLICDNPPYVADETYAIHLWNEMWRLENFNKNASYPSNSIYELLKRKYL